MSLTLDNVRIVDEWPTGARDVRRVLTRPATLADLVEVLKEMGAKEEPIYEMERLPVDAEVPEGWREILLTDDWRLVAFEVSLRLVLPLDGLTRSSE